MQWLELVGLARRWVLWAVAIQEHQRQVIHKMPGSDGWMDRAQAKRVMGGGRQGQAAVCPVCELVDITRELDVAHQPAVNRAGQQQQVLCSQLAAT